MDAALASRLHTVNLFNRKPQQARGLSEGPFQDKQQQTRQALAYS